MLGWVVFWGLAAAAAAAFGSETTATPAPVIFVPEAAQEFAPVVAGTPAYAEFAIQNRGTAPLKLERVRPD